MSSDEIIDDPLMIDLRDRPNRHVIILEGEIDLMTAPRLHERINHAFDQEVDEVLVDLRDISFIDSTGLGVLVNGRQRARSTGVRFTLMLPEGEARFPFEVTGLAAAFQAG